MRMFQAARKTTRKINSAWEADTEGICLIRAKTAKSPVGEEVYFKGSGRSETTLKINQEKKFNVANNKKPKEEDIIFWRLIG